MFVGGAPWLFQASLPRCANAEYDDRDEFVSAALQT
jgi:hypothetical protein